MHMLLTVPWRRPTVLLGALTLAIAALSLRDRSPAVANAPVVHIASAPAPVRTTHVPRLAIELAVSTYHVELTATHLYWTQASYEDTGVLAHLMRMSIDGGVPELIADDASYGFVIAGDRIYYVASPAAEIRRVPLSGGASELVATASSEPYAIAVGGGYVYWTSARGVMRAPANGGSAVRLGLGRAPDPITADDEFLYIGGRKLERVAHGTARSTVLASLPDQPSDVVVHRGDLYVAVGGALIRRSRDDIDTIAVGGVAHRLALGTDALYWTSWGDHTAPALERCDGFEAGTARQIDLHTRAVSVVEASCDLRGMAVGPTARFAIEGSRVARRR